MKGFLKSKQPFALGEHQFYKPEDILFPDEARKHIAFMSMEFKEEETDRVIITADHIDLETGELESFKLTMKINGIKDFAENNKL